MSYLIKVTCPTCGRDYRFSSEAPEEEALCPFSDCVFYEAGDHASRVQRAAGGHYRWHCSCGAKGVRLSVRGTVEAGARQHVNRQPV